MVTDGCKVDRAMARYELDGAHLPESSVDKYLLNRWTGAEGRRAEGYRTLTEWFNKRLLKRAYDEAGRETLGARVDTEYDVLTGEHDLARGELLDELAAEGLDPDDVLSEMVSWSTMRHHLNDCLDGAKARRPAETDWERQSVAIARDRLEEKVREATSALSSKGALPGGDDAAVDVQVQLRCPNCEAQVPLRDALNRGYICREHVEDTDGAAALRSGGESE